MLSHQGTFEVSHNAHYQWDLHKIVNAIHHILRHNQKQFSQVIFFSSWTCKNHFQLDTVLHKLWYCSHIWVFRRKLARTGHKSNGWLVVFLFLFLCPEIFLCVKGSDEFNIVVVKTFSLWKKLIWSVTKITAQVDLILPALQELNSFHKIHKGWSKETQDWNKKML